MFTLETGGVINLQTKATWRFDYDYSCSGIRIFGNRTGSHALCSWHALVNTEAA